MASKRTAHTLFHFVNLLFVRLLFRFSVEGRQHLLASGPFIITSNHSCPLDLQILAAVLPLALLRHAYWAGKESVVLRIGCGVPSVGAPGSYRLLMTPPRWLPLSRSWNGATSSFGFPKARVHSMENCTRSNQGSAGCRTRQRYATQIIASAILVAVISSREEVCSVMIARPRGPRPSCERCGPCRSQSQKRRDRRG